MHRDRGTRALVAGGGALAKLLVAALLAATLPLAILCLPLAASAQQDPHHPEPLDPASRDPNATTGRATHDPGVGSRPSPEHARRSDDDHNTAARRATHDPRPWLPPLHAWQFLERNNRVVAARAAAQHAPHRHHDDPGTLLPRPPGAGRYVCAVVTCADVDVDFAALFGLQRRDVLVLRLPGAYVTAEATALLERTIAQHRLSLVLVLGHTGCDALRPSGAERPDALDRRLTTLRHHAGATRLSLPEALVHRQRELLLAASEPLQRRLAEDDLRIVPGLVDEAASRVRWCHRRAHALPLAPVK